MAEVKKTRFVIVNAPRTGSTMLRLMLNSHPDICCHGEVFTGDKKRLRSFVGLNMQVDSPLKQMFLRMRNDAPARFLGDFVFYAGAHLAAGFKIVYSVLESPLWEELFRAVLDDREIRIIHLKRKNRLKRYLSHYIANHVTGVNVVFSDKDRPVIPKLTISPEECLADMEAVEADERRFAGYFSNHEVFDLSYEDITGGGSRLLDR